MCDSPSASPCAETLLSGLQAIATDLRGSTSTRGKDTLISEALPILHALADRLEGVDVGSIMIPDSNGSFHPQPTIIFNDRGSQVTEAPQGYYLAHSSVSWALAKKLDLRQVSDEQFEEGNEDFETFQMAEDLATRVRNTLRNYDIRYASNEWVANADDAKASVVRLAIQDGATYEGTLLKSEHHTFQEAPSLIIFNNGVFTPSDFEGIGRVGLGSKGDSPDSIGRFGLGAFSFYHFTEVRCIYSKSGHTGTRP